MTRRALKSRLFLFEGRKGWGGVRAATDGGAPPDVRPVHEHVGRVFKKSTTVFPTFIFLFRLFLNLNMVTFSHHFPPPPFSALLAVIGRIQTLFKFRFLFASHIHPMTVRSLPQMGPGPLVKDMQWGRCCHRLFNTPEELAEHVRSCRFGAQMKRDDNAWYACNFSDREESCSVAVLGKNLKKHYIEVHAFKPKAASNMIKHIHDANYCAKPKRSVADGPVQAYKCPFPDCQRTYLQKRDMRTHITFKHPPIRISTITDGSATSTDDMFLGAPDTSVFSPPGTPMALVPMALAPMALTPLPSFQGTFSGSSSPSTSGPLRPSSPSFTGVGRNLAFTPHVPYSKDDVSTAIHGDVRRFSFGPHWLVSDMLDDGQDPRSPQPYAISFFTLRHALNPLVIIDKVKHGRSASGSSHLLERGNRHGLT
jgi:hypothetical protein